MSSSLLNRPLLAAGMLILVAALLGGIQRTGLVMPLPLMADFAAAHGPLMVGGFLGTLIALERAAALGSRAGYFGPALSAIGAVLVVLVEPMTAGASMLAAGSLGLVATTIAIARRAPSLESDLGALAAAIWFAGNLLWLGGLSILQVVPWWIGFVALTITAERLELSRVVAAPDSARRLFVAVIGFLVVGLILALVMAELGFRLFGAALVVLALWLARYDLARRTVRRFGVAKFSAVALLAGYVWLSIAGITMAVASWPPKGLGYDMLVHSFFLGFAISMLFGHAPIVLPALLGLPLRFRPTLYLPLALLHLTVLARAVGDLGDWPMARQWTGTLNAIALLFFFALAIAAIRPWQSPNRDPRKDGDATTE